MAQQPLPRAHLLTLPQDLRNKIYTLTFEDHIATVCILGVVRHNASLLATCKQIRLEATALYYKHATFLVHEFRALRYWLERLDEGRRMAVRKVLWADPRPRWLHGPPTVLELREDLAAWKLRLSEGVLESVKLGILGDGEGQDDGDEE